MNNKMKKGLLLLVLAVLIAGGIFAQNSQYSAQQNQIQGICNFHEPDKVWTVIERHTAPGPLYRALVAGLTGTPSKADYQTIIQALCNFSGPNDVWTVIESHGFSADLYRVLAQGLVGARNKATSVPSNFSAYQQRIQTACNFSNPQKVWEAFDAHHFREDLYRKLAGVATKNPSRNDYKAIIQARCKFQEPAGVWAVLDRHSSADDLYRKLALNMLGR
jgi:hypothetical protein